MIDTIWCYQEDDTISRCYQVDAIFDGYGVQGSPTSWEKPLVTTELRASSHISQLDNFQTLKRSNKILSMLARVTCAAILYSSIRGSLVKWNCRGSSVEIEMFRPLHIGL